MTNPNSVPLQDTSEDSTLFDTRGYTQEEIEEFWTPQCEEAAVEIGRMALGIALAFAAFNAGIYSLSLLQYTTGKLSTLAIIIGITGISLSSGCILVGIEIRKSRKLLEDLHIP